MITIGGYVIDAATKESVTYETEVTRYPVESGGVIADHSVLQEPVLSIDFIVSDAPIGEVARARTGSESPALEAWGFLLALRATREPFTVSCSIGTFDDMVFETLERTADAESGAAAVVSATFRRIDLRDIVRTVVSEIQPKRRLGKRNGRITKGVSMWSCPPGTAVDSDPAFNLAQGCREVLYIRSGRLAGVYWNDTLKPLTVGELAHLNSQTMDDDEFKMEFDSLAVDDEHPGGQWVFRKPSYSNMPAKSYPAMPSKGNQVPWQNPFEVPSPDPIERGNRI